MTYFIANHIGTCFLSGLTEGVEEWKIYKMFNFYIVMD